MDSLKKIYVVMCIALSSFVACGMEEGILDENVEFETFNLTHRSPVKNRVIPVSPRVSRKKQESNVLPQGLDAWQADTKSNSASPNLLRKVLKDMHEVEMQKLMPLVSPVRSRKSKVSVKKRQLNILKPKKA